MRGFSFPRTPGQVRRLFAYSTGTTSRETWRKTLEYWGGCCAYCGLPSHRLQRDHVNPIALGGPDSYLNIVPACVRCNRAKGIRRAVDFLASMGRNPELFIARWMASWAVIQR